SVLCLKQFNNEYLFVGTSDSLVRVYKLNANREFELEHITTIYSTMDVGDILSLHYLVKNDTLVIGTQRCCLFYVNNILQDVSDSESIISHLDHLPSNRFDKFFDSIGPTGNKTGSPFVPNTIPPKNKNFHIIQIPRDNIINYAHNGFIYCLNSYTDSNHDDIEYLVSSSGDGLTKKWVINDATNSLELIDVIDISSTLDDDLNEENGCILSQYIKFPLLYQGLNNNKVQVISLLTNKLVEIIDLNAVSSCSDQVIYDIAASTDDDSYIFISNSSNVFYFNIKDSDTLVENDGNVYFFSLSEILAKPNQILNESNEFFTKKNIIEPMSVSSNEQMIEDLYKFISFKTTAENMQELHSCASFLKDLLTKMKSQVEIISNLENGIPILKATFKANNLKKKNCLAKTILIYAHYDVVPSNCNDHFKLLIQDGYLKGRGVSDNKGPIISMIHAVNELYSSNQLTNNVVFLFEGCEEIGSIGFEETLKQAKDDSEVIDHIIMANSYWIGDQLPCLNYGMRGVINMKVSISGSKALHSGTDGGLGFETTKDLIFCINDLIATKDGSLNIKDFYDEKKNVISKEELKLFDEIVATKEGGATLNTLINKWTKPSVSITCMEGSSGITVVPKEASVTLSIRTVATQKSLSEIKSLIIEHLQTYFQSLKSDNELKIEILNEAEPWLGDFKNEIYQIAMEELQNVWHTKNVLLIREGGSIPTIQILKRLYPNAELMILPNGQASDNAHLPNEKFRLENFFKLKTVLKNIVHRI
ncbi:Zn-dependent exopeptidase, partial [Hanseniaspora valbyensis NRRL Y-1626]